MNTEEMIQVKGSAPRLMPADIEAVIARTVYHRLTSVLTICVLTLRNGFTLVGSSACVSAENYDREIGQKIARENAADQIWALEGYLLKQRVHDGTLVDAVLDRESMPLTGAARLRSFGAAITSMKNGSRCARQNWNGPDQWIALQVPDDYSTMRQPYLYISPVGGELIPWLASQADMLAEDWYVVE
jgi:hypothetical protein